MFVVKLNPVLCALRFAAIKRYCHMAVAVCSIPEQFQQSGAPPRFSSPQPSRHLSVFQQGCRASNDFDLEASTMYTKSIMGTSSMVMYFRQLLIMQVCLLTNLHHPSIVTESLHVRVSRVARNPGAYPPNADARAKTCSTMLVRKCCTERTYTVYRKLC